MSKTIFAAAAFAAVCLTARADLAYSSSATVTSYLTPAAGQVQVYASAAPAVVTVGQGQPSAGSGAAFTALSETFTPSSTFTLGGFDLFHSGINGLAIGVHLYDVTGVSTNTTGAFYFTGTDLFGNGAGLSFTTPGAAGEVQGTFLLSNGGTSDQVTLTAGRTYALELWTPTSGGSAGNFNWWRAGQVATDGQMMGTHNAQDNTVSRNTIAALGLAGGVRTASLALYSTPVPEPSSLALLGFGGLALLIRRRSAK